MIEHASMYLIHLATVAQKEIDLHAFQDASGPITRHSSPYRKLRWQTGSSLGWRCIKLVSDRRGVTYIL